jgi:hypothetical protein
MTQKAGGLDPMTGITSLPAPEAWKLLGEASAWVLDLLTAQEPNAAHLHSNVGQYVHFLANQLQLKAAGITCE